MCVGYVAIMNQIFNYCEKYTRMGWLYVSPYLSNTHAYIFNMKSKETQPPHPGVAQAPSTPSLYFAVYEHA